MKKALLLLALAFYLNAFTQHEPGDNGPSARERMEARAEAKAEREQKDRQIAENTRSALDYVNFHLPINRK
jgi:hypothetical protein